MDEQERCAICRKIAEDMAIAGMGWHEDAIERLTRLMMPLIERIAADLIRGFASGVIVGLLPRRFPHRRYGIKSRYQGRVRYDAPA